MKHNSPTPMGFIGVGLVWLRFTYSVRAYQPKRIRVFTTT